MLLTVNGNSESVRFESVQEKKMKTINKMISRFSVLSLVIAGCSALALAQTGNNGQLNGTFRLNASKSDDVSSTVESLARSNDLSQDEREGLEDQLTAPETITIRSAGSDSNRITLSTSSSAESTFIADGRSQSIAQDDGSQVRVAATMRNGVLRLSRVGADSSFSITFAAEDNGQVLRVTRMVTTNFVDRTVYADSFYDRVGYSSVDPAGDTGDDSGVYSDDDDSYSSSDPDDNSGSSGGRNYPTTRTVSGRFIVPKGVELTGILDNKITTKASQDNDRFTMTVDSPGEYRGAVVEGYLSGIKRTGRVTGSSKLTFNFETIRLTTGEVYDFAGVLKNVTDSTGKVIKVGEEGDAKSRSKTRESVKRGGIGAGIGAIIGGIIGGGKGAIIGATIGGGAGAGSVIAEGRDDIELLPGSQITVESSSPNTDNR